MQDSLGSDLDEGALCGGPSKKSRKAGWYQPGPSTLGEILNVNAAAATHMVQMALESRHTQSLDRLKKFAQQPTVITSTFTGWATYEDTFLESRQNVADALGIEVGPTVWYRAIECSGHVQHALRHRKSSFRPLHVFDNNLDRLPEHVRRELENYMDEQLQVLAAHKKERQLSTITKAEYDQALANLNNDVLNHLRGQLKQMEFELEGDCRICNKKCPFSPMADPKFHGYMWCEGAGTICKPFSAMSSNPAWCDPSTISTLVWAYATRFDEPKSVHHECVVGFHEKVFIDIFKEVEDVLKDVCLPASENEYKGYGFQMQAFSPTDLGVPSERQRKYSHYELLEEEVPKRMWKFDGLFYRKLVATCGVYMAAPPAILEAEHAELEPLVNKKARSVADAGHEQGTLTLGDTHWSYLQSYLEIARQRPELCTSTASGELVWSVPLAICDVTQLATHRGIAHPRTGTDWSAWGCRHTCLSMPALLQNTLLYEMVTDRPIAVSECWLVQGFARPCMVGVPSELSACFACPDMLANSAEEVGQDGKVPLAVQRSIIGNSMHRAAVGHWILYTAL